MVLTYLVQTCSSQKDSYKSTGCFDAICSGFVQTGQVALGAIISPISSSEGPQYYLPVAIYMV